MRLDVFLNSSAKLILFRHFKMNFTLKIEFLNGNDVQAGLINHICLSFFSMLMWISPAEDETLFGWYHFTVEMGEWGPYEALTPTEKYVVWI